MTVRLFLLAAVLVPFAASAAPPAPGSEDAEILMPHQAWVERQHTDDGQYCCDISDGRTVAARITANGWQVFVTAEKFPGSTPGWHDVPASAVIHKPNPVGMPIAWIVRDRIYCFCPGSSS